MCGPVKLEVMVPEGAAETVYDVEWVRGDVSVDGNDRVLEINRVSVATWERVEVDGLVGVIGRVVEGELSTDWLIDVVGV